MNVERSNTVTKGSFFIPEGNQRLAEMTYSMAGPELMIIDHTEVSDMLRGKGAGKELVQAAVEYARQSKIKILPLCPFAKSVFEKTPEYNDVLSA